MDITSTVGSNALGNLVESNVIGTDYTGVYGLGNGFDGVYINAPGHDSAASDNSVIGNIIAFSIADGVQIGDDPSDLSVGNDVEGNSIHDNAAIGIGLGGTTFVANDPNANSGPNLFQNYPTITSPQIDSSGDLTVTYADPTDGGSTFPITVDFYIADATGRGRDTSVPPSYQATQEVSRPSLSTTRQSPPGNPSSPRRPTPPAIPPSSRRPRR